MNKPTNRKQHPATRLAPRAVAATGVLLSLALPSALAQDASSAQRIERLLDRPVTGFLTPEAPGTTLDERLYLATGLRYTAAALNVNNNDGTSTQLFQSLAKPALRMSYAGAHELSAVFNLDFRLYGEGDDRSAATPSGQLARPFIDELWYRFDLAAARRLATDARATERVNLELTFGKRDVTLGTGLVLDRSLLVAEARADVDIGRGRNLVLTGFGARTPRKSFIDFDGSRPGFDNDTERTFLGVGARVTGARFRPFAYALWQLDDNNNRTQSIDIGGTPTDTEFGYDSAYFGLGFEASAGERWVYGAEAVYQTGRSTSNPFDYDTGVQIEPTTDDIQAWAATAAVTYLFLDDRKSRTTAQLTLASGDGDRISSSQTVGGNAAGTTDHAFNAFGTVAGGYVLAPEPANLAIARLGGSSSFGPRSPGGDPLLRAGVDLFAYAKLDENAGTSFASKEGERFVGLGLDLYSAWTVSSDVTIDVRYGLFLPGEAATDDVDDPRHLIYVGITYAF